MSACPILPSVWKFDPNGNLITKWRDVGIGSCQLNSFGLAVNSLGSVYVADTYNNRIQKFSPILSSITLESPPANEHFNACSLNSPPTFSWTASEAFADYKVQFSPLSPRNDFKLVYFEAKVEAPTTQITFPLDIWEEMMITLPGFGTFYWRVVGIKADGTTEISAVRSFSLGAEPVGNPNISPTKKRSRPVLTWQTNCNTKFRVWFSSDSNFSKKTYIFEIENLTGGEGTFSKTLTSLEWLRIRMLVRNKTGIPIYWYVESWDGLGRYSKTDVMNFVLTD